MKRNALDGVTLDPIGFKIGLEVIAKAHYKRAIEVPYVFTDRVAGQSKLNQGEILNYLKQLWRIYGGQACVRRPNGKCLRRATRSLPDAPIPDWLRIRREAPQPAPDAAMWVKCPSCGEMLYRKDLEANASVCTRCQYHFRMHAHDRINMLVDRDFVEIGGDIVPGDPLGWVDKRTYTQKLETDRANSHLSEAVVTGFCTIGGSPLALGVMDFSFRGGTMGTVVGERITAPVRRGDAGGRAAGQSS